MNKKIDESNLLDLNNERLFENNTLMKNLIKTPKEELVNILLEFSRSYDGVNDDLKLKYANEDELLDICINITNRYINEAKTDGKILSEDVKTAIIGVNQVLENVSKLMVKKNYINAISISMSILSILIKELSVSEDDNNLIGFLIDKAIDVVKKSVIQVVEANKSKEYKREIYFIIRDFVIMDLYYTWIDWRCEILRACLPLCEDKYVRDSLIITVDDLLSEGKENKWHKLLVEKELKSIIFSIKKEYVSLEDSINYAEKNIEYGYFKNIAIKSAFEKKQYEKIIYLANRDVVNIGVDYSDDVNDYLFNAYVELGDKDNQRVMAEEFLLNGKLEYFSIYKKLTNEKDWNKTFNILLELFLEKGGNKYSDSYIRLILLEDRHDKLLEICENSTEALLAYGEKIYNNYPNEIKNLLDDYLTVKGKSISGISDYIEIVKIIEVYGKTVGNKPALSIINQFIEEFSKNTIFMEKLRNLQKTINEKNEDDDLSEEDQDKKINEEYKEKSNTKRGKIINMPFK